MAGACSGNMVSSFPRPYQGIPALSAEEFALSLLLSGGEIGEGGGLACCSSCRKLVYARKVHRDGKVHLIKYCHHEHKVFETLAEKTDYAFDNPDVPVDRLPHFSFTKLPDRISEADIVNFRDIQNILFLITDRCNSRCKICYDKTWKPRQDMSLDFLREKLALFKGKRILLYGGDPTVREDLPEIIRIINDSGNYSAMFSNCLKLADPQYLDTLLDAGLRFLYFSFSGFKEDIYERVWGGAHEYAVKMKAWENLARAHAERNLIGKLRVAIAPTFVRGVNDDQVMPLLEFAREHEFISEVLDRPLFLPDNTSFEAHLAPGFHIMSRDEIDRMMCASLGIPAEYMKLFYDVRLEFVKRLKSALPAVNIMYPRPHQLYLLREGEKLVPMFGLEELGRIRDALRGKKPWRLFSKKRYLRLASEFVTGGFNPTEIELRLAKMKVLRVAPGSPPVEFFLNSTQITSLCYGSRELSGLKYWV